MSAGAADQTESNAGICRRRYVVFRLWRPRLVIAVALVSTTLCAGASARDASDAGPQQDASREDGSAHGESREADAQATDGARRAVPLACGGALCATATGSMCGIVRLACRSSRSEPEAVLVALVLLGIRRRDSRSERERAP